MSKNACLTSAAKQAPGKEGHDCCTQVSRNVFHSAKWLGLRPEERLVLLSTMSNLTGQSTSLITMCEGELMEAEPPPSHQRSTENVRWGVLFCQIHVQNCEQNYKNQIRWYYTGMRRNRKTHNHHNNDNNLCIYSGRRKGLWQWRTQELRVIEDNLFKMQCCTETNVRANGEPALCNINRGTLTGCTNMLSWHNRMTM